MKKTFISGLLSVLYAALMILSLFVPNGMASALVTALTGRLFVGLGGGAALRLGGMRVAFIGKRQRRR